MDISKVTTEQNMTKLTPIKQEKLSNQVLTVLQNHGLRPYYTVEHGIHYMIEDNGTVWGTKNPQGRPGFDDYYYTPPKEGASHVG